MSAVKKYEGSLDECMLIQKLLNQGHGHICQTQGLMYKEELQSAEVIDLNPSVFFLTPATAMLWPTELNIRDEKKSLLLDIALRSSQEKISILHKLKFTLLGLTKSQSMSDEILAIADELITNALFNAPFVNPGTNINEKVDRNKIVSLAEAQAGRFFLAEDGTRLLIGCEDPFGSLNVPAYLRRVSDCYTNSVGKTMNFGQGGAGIGSFIIFNSGSSLYYGVSPGKQTVLGCLIPYRLGARQREGLPKHLHWIQN
jgi:hypothetical protein